MPHGEDSTEMAEDKAPEEKLNTSSSDPDNYKENSEVFVVEVHVTNVVDFKVKTNDQAFLRQWLARQLKPLSLTTPPGAYIDIHVQTDPVETDDFQAEVYGKPERPDQKYEVLEHVKDEVFERQNADSRD